MCAGACNCKCTCVFVCVGVQLQVQVHVCTCAARALGDPRGDCPPQPTAAQDGRTGAAAVESISRSTAMRRPKSRKSSLNIESPNLRSVRAAVESSRNAHCFHRAVQPCGSALLLLVGHGESLVIPERESDRSATTVSDSTHSHLRESKRTRQYTVQSALFIRTCGRAWPS